ncbi:MAG TPA: hypothetical protein VMD08_03190 [Candidatus Baltobacteraceae bacterium]|nr:hypothetical protein [Candidatus Baltobacteraceae bacterium]
MRERELFTTPAERRAGAPDVKALHAKIGQLARANDTNAKVSSGGFQVWP